MLLLSAKLGSPTQEICHWHIKKLWTTNKLMTRNFLREVGGVSASMASLQVFNYWSYCDDTTAY